MASTTHSGGTSAGGPSNRPTRLQAVALHPKPLGHRYKSEAELLAHARTLAGHTAGELAEVLGRTKFNESEKAVGKTGVGVLAELYLGRAQNSSEDPDIGELSVEVKTLPMERRGKRRDWAVKEPTSLTMIQYDVVDKEAWAQAYVRGKLERILWIPYEHDYDDKRKHRFREPFLWSPDPEDLPAFEKDYNAVRKVINQGRAHELSETLSLILAARRKGESGEDRSQPHSALRAPSRAWALKTGYTGTILEKYVLQQKPVSLLDLAKTEKGPALRTLRGIKQLEDVMPFVEQQYLQFEGQEMHEIAAALGVRIGAGKNRNATLVRQVLGLPSKGVVEEFEKLGIRVHQLNVRPSDGVLHEAVSFPAMKLKKFVEEEWESSEFAEHVDRILFVPTYSETGKVDSKRTLGRAFFWEPDGHQTEGIAAEWRMFQRLIREGKAAYLEGEHRKTAQVPNETGTTFIHMRPHGRRGEDVDEDHLGNTVTKQSLWLNKRFVEGLLASRARRT